MSTNLDWHMLEICGKHLIETNSKQFLAKCNTQKMHTRSWLKIKQKNKNYCQPAFFVRMNNLKIIVLCKERNSKKSFFGIHLIIIITCFRFIWLLLPFHICYLILKHKLSFIVHFIHQYHLKAEILPQKIPSKNETCHIRIILFLSHRNQIQ